MVRGRESTRFVGFCFLARLIKREKKEGTQNKERPKPLLLSLSFSSPNPRILGFFIFLDPPLIDGEASAGSHQIFESEEEAGGGREVWGRSVQACCTEEWFNYSSL